MTGLVGIAYFEGQGNGLGDPETVFIRFSDVLFHPYITGFLMAAILAAIMSTISSQLLVTSSALTEDFYKTFLNKKATDKQLVLTGRIAVLVIAVIGSVLAWNPSATILSLVGYAWAGFGSAFGPIILLSLYWKRMTKQGALAGMLSGAITVIAWVQLGLSDTLYEMVPGFFTSLLFTVVVSLLTKQPVESVQDTFDDMEEELKEAIE